MIVTALDHLVLTVADIAATTRFYSQVLGMTPITFDNARVALHLGSQKINLHQCGHEIAPHALAPTPGSADICFLTSLSHAELSAHLDRQGIIVELGPVQRTGATRPITSFYIRDPDGNLIELASAN